MEVQKRTIAGLLIVAAAIGAAGARYGLNPVIKTETVTKDKVVTVVRTVKDKDGTVTTDRTTVTDRVKKDVAAVPVLKVPPQWRVTGGYKVNGQDYMLGVERRILGPVFVGVQATASGSILATVSVEF